MQSQVSFFACPATGQVSWDPPVGNFVLPHSGNDQLWEISDESRGGIPYNPHTEKSDGFVIPLTVLRTLRWVVVSPSRSLRQRIRARLPMQPGSSRAPWFTIRVHIRKRSVAQFKPWLSAVLCEWPDCPYEEKPERPAYASQPSFNFTNIIENQQTIYHRPPFFNTIATGACAATHPWLRSEHSADPHSFAPLRGHHRTQRSTHRRSASHSIPCSVYRNAHTRCRGCQSYSRSSPTASSHSAGQSQRAIFRIPGGSNAVAALKMRLDRGSYTLEGVDDPLVPASLFKLWLRELVDPLVPSEMYNDCIAFAGDAEACCAAVERLPTANRRVVLFVISFLQLFLDERVLAATKMTSANLALVMAPNLLRCGSDSMAIVFNNAQYEQAFVHNLPLHLNCGEIDAQYVPQHGLGPSAAPRASKSRNRRAHS